MIRIATYNVEWFDALFDDAGALVRDDSWSGRYNVTKAAQTAALGQVFTALDADAVMVIEGPDISRGRDGAKALAGFAKTFGLRARSVLAGFPNDTQQEILLMFDPDRLTAGHDPKGGQTGKKGARDAPRFDGVFRLDLDTDAAPELITWSKPPLEAKLRTPNGLDLRLIGVHAKSKAPHGAKTPSEELRFGIENRRKQLAQCIWLRQRVDQHLQRGERLVVMGDFNDGPGLDEYEKLFGRSSIEVVLGEDGPDRLFDPHARMALARPNVAAPTTSRFKLRDQDRYLSALLDYIMVSPNLVELGPIWRIWHPFEDAACYRDDALRHALLTASDHFPVTIDINL